MVIELYYIEKSKTKSYYYIKCNEKKYNEIRCLSKNDAEEICEVLNNNDNYVLKRKIEDLKKEDKRLNDVIIDLYNQIGELNKIKRKYYDIIFSQKDLLEIFFDEME